MSKKYPIILAIDTSCDETSVAVTQGMRVLSNAIASQIEIHRKYGGVMPLEAKLAHHEKINPTYQEALRRAGIKPQEVDAIAVTVGPGLAIALEVGIDFAKSLSTELGKPLIAVNHMAGHLYSVLAVNSKGDPEPTIRSQNPKEIANYKLQITNKNVQSAICNLQFDNSSQLSSLNSQVSFQILALLISGKHTDIIGINLNQRENDFVPSRMKLGQTVDDAAGECLDKFARMLDLGYPGAHVMEQLAKEGDPTRFSLPLPMTQSHDLNYSFSGLKTAGRHLIEKITNSRLQITNNYVQSAICNLQFNHSSQVSPLSATDIRDLAASFQAAVIRAVQYKLKKAIEQYQPTQLWVGGGVVANLELRKHLRKLAQNYNLDLRLPYSKRLMGDNAGMIGVAAYFQWLEKDFVQNINELHREPRLSL